MIETVWFENTAGEVMRPEDYGLILKSFDAPSPAARTYFETVDGKDGVLDMSEWAGEVLFAQRTVTIEYRDMDSAGYSRLINFLHGRRVRITHSETPDVYFQGRCEKAEPQERKHVTNVKLTFTCDAYAMRHTETTITATVGSGTEITLRAARKSVSPKVTVTAVCTLSFGSRTVSLSPGTYTIPGLIVKDEPMTVTVSGSGTITFVWRDGVL